MSRFLNQNQYSSGTLEGVPSWHVPIPFEVEASGSLEPTPSVSDHVGGCKAQPRPPSVFVGKGIPDPRRT